MCLSLVVYLGNLFDLFKRVLYFKKRLVSKTTRRIQLTWFVGTRLSAYHLYESFKKKLFWTSNDIKYQTIWNSDTANSKVIHGEEKPPNKRCLFSLHMLYFHITTIFSAFKSALLRKSYIHLPLKSTKWS